MSREHGLSLLHTLLDPLARVLHVLAEAFGGLAAETGDGQQQEGEEEDAEAMGGFVHVQKQGRFDLCFGYLTPRPPELRWGVSPVRNPQCL